jgi:hypothetical protein
MYLYYGFLSACDCERTYNQKTCLLLQQLVLGIEALEVVCARNCKCERMRVPFEEEIDCSKLLPNLSIRDELLKCMLSNEFCRKELGKVYCGEFKTISLDPDRLHQPKKIWYTYSTIITALFFYYNTHKSDLPANWATLLVCALDWDFTKVYLYYKARRIFDFQEAEALNAINEIRAYIEDILSVFSRINVYNNDVILPAEYSSVKEINSLRRILCNSMLGEDTFIEKYNDHLADFIEQCIQGMGDINDNLKGLYSDDLDGIRNCLDEIEGHLRNGTFDENNQKNIWKKIGGYLTIPQQMAIPA